MLTTLGLFETAETATVDLSARVRGCVHSAETPSERTRMSAASVTRCRLLVAVLGLLAPTLPGLAAGRPGASVAVGTGWFDCNRRQDQAFEARIEYRRPVSAHGLQAVAAGSATTDGAIFVGGGIAYSIPFGRFDVTPSFVPGLYRKGNGRDLGYPVEFRSQLEVGLRLGRSRLALALSHTSNGSLGSSNPGQESLTLSAQLPFGRPVAR